MGFVGPCAVRDTKTHELKIKREPMRSLWRREKTAELRFDDRDFRVGDMLHLREWGPRSKYTGRSLTVEVTHITRLSHWIVGVDHRWVMLSLKFIGGSGG